MAAYLVQSVREMVWLVDSRTSEKPTNDLQQADHPNVGSAKAAKSHRRHVGRDEHAADLLGTRMQIKRKKRTVAGVDQDELLDPLILADPDSCFHEFMGVHIHHKISTAEGDEDELKPVEVSISQESSHSHAGNDRLGLPMILLHGFAASLFSWRKVMKPLANLVGSSVLAFDRPAFGLTSRVLEYPLNPSSAMAASTQLNPYSTAFSTSATLSFMGMLMGDKAILVGHSAGCVVAVDAYFEEPERVAALILVAPAIVAPLLLPSNSNKGELSEREGDMENRGSVWDDKEHMIYSVLIFLQAVCFRVQEAVIWMIKKSIYLLSCFCKNLLSEILRSYFAVLMVRFIFDRFGLAIVRNSWYDASLATEQDINGYTKPLRAKDWDRAILEFVIALLSDIKPKELPSCKRSLSEIACPVLIITGDHDHIVPAWNAKRLSRAIPGSHLRLIENCGHLPHEEKPQEFLSTVGEFLLNLKDV
ncbi:uncharacterized protein LOC116255305 isoform X2 [Nymphaea colorata]|uniref:uncharacterized protein LOC116255305 isoform X2 n=1 Tax=Nymphaea colorata TaxID=210225 RepID=UPI00129E487C|nr:uncharacterized protein LOC116255305 isoform X2 [Nymphaea colorata]